MSPEEESARRGRWRLGRRLVAVFVLALVMGPGPGIYLVNPAADDPRPLTVWGMPVLYAWAVFWFMVMAITVTVAYRTLWAREEES